MDEDIKYSLREFFRDIARYIAPHKLRFFAAVFLRLTSDLARLYPVLAFSQLVVLLSGQLDASLSPAILRILFFWMLSILYSEPAHNLAKYFGFQVAEQAAFDLMKDCLRHIFTLDLSWQEAENSGNKMKRIDKGQEAVDDSIRRIFDTWIEVGVNTVGIFFVFFAAERSVSYGLLVFVLTYFSIGSFLIRKAIRQERIVNIGYEDLSGLTFEALNNIHTIKALGIDHGILKTITTKIRTLIEEIRKRIFIYQFQSSVLNLHESLFGLGVISFISWGIWQGQFRVSLLVLFVGLFRRVVESTRELTEVTQQLFMAKIRIGRAMSILRTRAKIEDPARQETQLTYPLDWRTLRLQRVHFSYARGQALQDISLSIQRGERIGIVGLSGAGKSTLFKLLLDLYEEYDGDIFLDNLSFKHMRRQSYIDHVSVVLQDTELFNMSLRENIEIASVTGKHPVSIDEVIALAHLDDVVAGLPMGVETMIGEKGIKLSGGQRQRLGIARALYRQPDILLLDEATSHLDAHSEKLIQQALEECMHQFTMVVIAHRLSTIMKMDRIVVLEKGKIAEVGTFVDLLEKDGLFAQMWREQKL